MLYFAFVHPHIIYGIEVYANACKSTLDKLYKLNNKLIRILFNKQIETPVYSLYKMLNTLPLSKLHEVQLLKLVHKCLFHKNLMPSIFRDYYVESKSIHQHNTRSSIGDLFIPTVKSKCGQRCSLFRASLLWNNLPSFLKVNSSVSAFKRNIKMFSCNNLAS